MRSKKLNGKKYFRIKKRIDQLEKDKFWALGEKAIKFELFRLECIHMEIYSVISWAVDYDNYGISGVEKYFDKELKKKIT